MGLGVCPVRLLLHPTDIHPAGVPSAAWNEEQPDPSVGEKQEDHPWHYHPVLQVDSILEICFKVDSFLLVLTVFFSSLLCSHIRILLPHAAHLVSTKTASSTSTSPPYCCSKRMRKPPVIWVQSRKRCSLCVMLTLWSECCRSSPCCTAPASSRTVCALLY